MADPEEPDDGGRPEEGKILSPEELDISTDEHVTKLDEGRFVVSPDARQADDPAGRAPPAADRAPGNAAGDTGRAETDQGGASEQPAPGGNAGQKSNTGGASDAAGGREPDPARDEVSREQVHRWLRESFEAGGSRYGFDITAAFDGAVSQRRLASNDVVTVFESLLVWYAQQVDEDTPVEEILGILLMEANVPVRYPPESLRGLVASAGLGPEDTVADLLAAVGEEDGVEL
jgi:hypothetical protein